jgi:flagella basal body P-ring formation protein FlgA
MNRLFLSLLALASLLAVPARADVAASSVRLGPGEPFTPASFEALVAHAETAESAGRRLALKATAPGLPLDNRAAAPVTITLEDLRLDETVGRFAAVLSVRVEGGPTNRLDLAGTAEAEAEVPVAARPLDAGTILERRDIDLAWIPERQLQPDTVLTTVDLVGREADRRLMPGRPVRAGEVRPPRLVRRGDLVTIVYAQDGLELRARGRALEDGAMGDAVRLQNVDSHREIRATVVDVKQVAIRPLAGGGS